MSFSEWLYTKKNIAGCGVALVGAPVLLATGLAAPPLALALVPVFYAIGALIAPSEKNTSIAFTNALSKVEANNIQESLRVIQDRIDGKVSNAVAERVDRIASTITELLPRANELGKTSDEMRILIRTATDYLPSTLNPYLAMPRYYAEHKVIVNGQTAEHILCEQLDLIDGKLTDILTAIAQNDASAIMANGEFLRDRFGTSRLSLDTER